MTTLYTDRPTVGDDNAAAIVAGLVLVLAVIALVAFALRNKQDDSSNMIIPQDVIPQTALYIQSVSVT